MGYSKSGCHAQYVAVDERLCGVLPASMTFEEAAAFPVASMTAYHALVRLAGIRRGERLLIHAAAGGVGTAVIQIAKDIGVEVFATAGTDEKLSVARAQGADHVINYRKMNFASRVREISGGYGVDVVVDPVGGRVFRSGWNLLAGMGRYVLLGLSSVSGPGRLNFPRALWILGSMGVLVPARVLSSNRAFLAFNLGTLTGREEYLHDTGLELIRLYERRVLRPVIGQVLPFPDVARAHRMLQTGQTLGKVVITFDESRPVPEARNDSAHA
jgi:NADPH:quinone reductase-like Zn-dependent oxidoreductase